MINKFSSKIKRFGRYLLPSHVPDFMVIGGQKCGTTSLHFYLNQHPMLIGSWPKEVHYFNRDYHLGKTIQAYKKAFRGFGVGKQYFESTPAYLYHPQTSSLIRKHLPSVKMIVILRDPVKRAYSAWNHYKQLFESGHDVNAIQKPPRREGNLLFDSFFKDREVFPSFRECLDVELELIDKGVGFEPALIRRGLYLQQLEEYWKFFGKEQIMIIGFKDFISDIKGTLSGVENFIGINQHNWSNLIEEPRNARSYQEPMLKEDAEFLQKFYESPNQSLFDKVGKLNW